MNTFRIFSLAMATVLALYGFASAQCGVRQVDTTNLQLGLQAAPVSGGCSNGQCGAQASAQTFAPAPQALAFTQPQTSVMVNTPRVAVNVGVQRAYQPLYVVTTPQAIVAPAPQYALVSAVQAPVATATATAGVQAEVFTQQQLLAVDPSVQVAAVSACANGRCGRQGVFQRLRAPRRSVSVARSRSVTFN